MSILRYHSQRSTPKKRKRSLEFLGEGLAWCCGVATEKKLKTIALTERDTKIRLNSIENGLTKTIKTLTVNSKNLQEYTRQVDIAIDKTNSQTKTLEQTLRTLKQQISDSAKSTENNTLALIFTQFQTVKKILYLTRTLRKEKIFSACKDNKLPVSLVSVPILQADLNVLRTELNSYGQDLAIPLTDLINYYELPISECSFWNNKVTVHIKVPVVPIHTKWQLFELITTPFAWENQTCTIQHQNLYLAVSKSSTRQISGTSLHHCSPYKNKLCYLPRFSADNLQGPECARKMYEGATIEDIASNCPMSCHPSTALTISEIEHETYVITHPTDTTHVSCHNISYPVSRIPRKPGAIKIDLPCDCKLVTNFNTVLIPTRFPCPNNTPNQAVITHILPAAWSNLKTFILNPSSFSNLPTFRNVNECLNNNWTSTVPHLNLSNFTPWRPVKKDVEEAIADLSTYGDNYGIHGDSILLIWNIVLSILVLHLFFKTNRAIAVPAVIQPVTAESPLSGNMSHITVLVLLITSFIIFLIYLMAKLCILKWWVKRRNPPSPPLPSQIEERRMENLRGEANVILEIQEIIDGAELQPNARVKAKLTRQSD